MAAPEKDILVALLSPEQRAAITAEEKRQHGSLSEAEWNAQALDALRAANEALIPVVRRWSCAVLPDRKYLFLVFDTARGPIVLALDYARTVGLRDDLRSYLPELWRSES